MKQDRKAVAVDAETKASNLKRLKRIEGQIRGIAKMVEDERYCADILMQVSSVQEALKGVSRELMRNHLRHCVTHNIERGKQNSEMYDELIDLFFKHNR